MSYIVGRLMLATRNIALSQANKIYKQRLVTVQFLGVQTIRMASSDEKSASESDRVLVTPEARDFLQKTHDLMVNETLVKGTDTTEKVLHYSTPQQLKESLDLSIEAEGASHERMLDIFRQTVHHSVSTAHPRYFNQLYNGRVIEGLAASWLIEALNTNVHTYECAPAFTIIEQYVIEKVNEKLGYSDGDGVFLPGGSLCNFTAMHLARYRYDNNVKQQGLRHFPKMRILSTSDAHYSVSKGAHFLGFGIDSVVDVATDDMDRMLPEDLEQKIIDIKGQGEVPLIVVATSGTTVMGAFDPLEKLATVCDRHGVWLHVDACWGGNVIFSDQHRHLVAGIERSDSVSISFHKMIGAQIQCSAVMVKQKELLRECNATEASYLFQPDKHYDSSYDIGMLTVQCGRKADGYKLWALWKARGDTGMQHVVDSSFQYARYFTDKLKSRCDEFRLIRPEFEYLNICFWYIPPSLRGQDETPEWWKKLAKVAPLIKKRMIDSGTIAIGYQPLPSKDIVNFFRIILDNPLLKNSDMDFALDEIDRLGHDL